MTVKEKKIILKERQQGIKKAFAAKNKVIAKNQFISK